jgi:hypothetical protein
LPQFRPAVVPRSAGLSCGYPCVDSAVSRFRASRAFPTARTLPSTMV